MTTATLTDSELQRDVLKALEWEPSVDAAHIITVRPRVPPTEVQSRIEEALKRGAEMDARRITAEVDGGKVILRGKVRSLAEKEEAELEAWGAPGVYCVENLITVDEDLQRLPWVRVGILVLLALLVGAAVWKLLFNP